MKIMSINVNFYPHSYGGATVVSEKAALGLTQLGHDVYNFCISAQKSPQDFSVQHTRLGTVITANCIQSTALNRFSNPPVLSLFLGLLDAIRPERLIIHSPQHLGVLDWLNIPGLLDSAVIVVHDYFWLCAQGHRVLPNGALCTRAPCAISCKDCCYYPGSIDFVYLQLRQFLDRTRKVVFPSRFLREQYAGTFHAHSTTSMVVQNPDRAEDLTSGRVELPADDGGILVAYLGGPGAAKGWHRVTRLFEHIKVIGGRKVTYVLFDAGMLSGQPWYPRPGDFPGHVCVVPAYHWSFAREVLSRIDVILMPSQVQESFGLAAREGLSVGARAVVTSAGALAELDGYARVYSATELGLEEALTAAATDDEDPEKPFYKNMGVVEYAKEIIA